MCFCPCQTRISGAMKCNSKWSSIKIFAKKRSDSSCNELHDLWTSKGVIFAKFISQNTGEVCHLPCAHVLCFSIQGLDALCRVGDICTCQRIIVTQVFFLLNHNYYAYKLYARLSWRTSGHIASRPFG